MQIQERQNIHTLILGSSVAYRGVKLDSTYKENPNHIYNLGTSAQTMVQSLALLSYTMQYHQLKNVVLLIEPDMLCSDGIPSQIDCIANFQSLRDLPSEISLFLDFRSINTLIIRQFKIWTDETYLHQSGPTQIYKDLLKKDGYVYTIEQMYTEKQCEPFPTKLISYQVKALKTLASQVLKKQISLTLIVPPMSPKKYNSIPPSFFEFIKSVYPEYIDLNRHPNINLLDDIFLDCIHLNDAGATRMSKLLYPYFNI